MPDDELASRAAKAIAGGDTAEFAAVAREAARRALGQRPHDVQLLGTLAMLSGYIAEMATGEGKTLSGALPATGYAGQPVRLGRGPDPSARRTLTGDRRHAAPLATNRSSVSTQRYIDPIHLLIP